MEKKQYLIYGTVIIVCAVIAVIFIRWSSPSTVIEIPECFRDEDCKLSLCDCECYGMYDETPEEKEGIFCGQNCEEWHGVAGCECIENKCFKILV